MICVFPRKKPPAFCTRPQDIAFPKQISPSSRTTRKGGQHFLLQTSILTRMDAAACQAVMAGPDPASSQHLLEEVERANLFVVPLDEHRHWYRYHDLFREALLARLQARQPELVPLLHTRAARWYASQGEWREAIAHALAAPDYPLAASLMEQTAEQFWERGEAATMARWVLELPEPLVREHARLMLTTALYLLATGFNTAQEQRERCHRFGGACSRGCPAAPASAPAPHVSGRQ